MGFFFLPGYALLFAMTEEHAGVSLAGSAAGVLMLTGNAGGVAVVFGMERINSTGWLYPIYLMIALMVLALGMAFFVGESMHANSEKK